MIKKRQLQVQTTPWLEMNWNWRKDTPAATVHWKVFEWLALLLIPPKHIS